MSSRQSSSIRTVSSFKSQKKRKRRIGARLECLERRYVLDSTVVLNEIMYKPMVDDPMQGEQVEDQSLEWLELHNQMSINMDISGWRLEDAVGYTFPQGTIVPGGGYLVVAADPTAVRDHHGITGVLGPFTGNLNNTGEEIQLIDNSDRLMDSVEYGDVYPWPTAPDGSGSSLAKRERNAGSADAANWTTSGQIGGTPGAANFLVEPTRGRDLTPVLFDDIWSYDDSGTDLGTAWREPGYDDSTWSSGAGVLYAGDVDVPEEVDPPETLVGYWTFDNTLSDLSIHGNDGQLLGGQFDADVPPEVQFGRSLSLSPGDQGVRIAADASLNSTIFTLAYWIKDPGQLTGSGVTFGETGHNRVTSRSGDTFETAVNNDVSAGGSSRVKFHAPGGWQQTQHQLDSDQWTHIAYVYDGATLEVFADGVSVHTQNIAIAPTGELSIGARHNGVETFVGNLDGVALWSVALTEGEVGLLASGDATPATLVIGATSAQTILSNTTDWRLSTVTADGGAAGTWVPAGDPLPDASTFTLTPTITSAAVIPHINTAATSLGAVGLASGNNITYYRTTFDLAPFTGISAHIDLAVDNGAQVYLNGELLGTETSFVTENWGNPLPSIDIAEDGTVSVNKFDSQATSFDNWIEGENEIIVAVRNPSSEASPAGGFAFRMTVTPSTPGSAGDGLHGYWPLDESSGSTAPNEVEGGTDGQMFNGVNWTNDPTRGQVLNFDGQDGYVNAGTLPMIAVNDDFTWSFWSRQLQVAPPDRPNDVILGNRFPDTGWIKFTPSAFEFRDIAPTFNSTIDYDDNSPALGWVHHAVVKDGNLLTYYRDGVAGPSSFVTAAIGPLPFYFGGNTIDENWTGLLDDIAVWTKALPVDSVAGLASGEFTPLTAPTGEVVAPPISREGTQFRWDRLDEDFEADAIDPSTFEVLDYGLETRGDGTSPNMTASTTTNDGRLTLGGTASVDYWGGKSVRTVETFDSSLPATITVDRVSLAGSGTAYRSSLWFWGDDGNYVHFSQNFGENGWQFNANNTGGSGTLLATGGGNNLGAFDPLDGDLGEHEMKIVYTPLGDGSATVEMYLDDVLGGSHLVTNWPDRFQVLLTGQARQATAAPPADTVTAVFDNLSVVQHVPQRYGDETELTQTVYLRKEFEFDGDTDLTTLQLTSIVDDGAVFYVNGHEVARQNMPAGAVDHTTAASSEVGDSPVNDPVVIPAEFLVQGTNVLAVELHQAAGSTDGYFAAKLDAAIAPVVPEEAPETVRFNELAAAGEGFWLELYNPGDATGDTYYVASERGIHAEFTLDFADYHVIDDLGFTVTEGQRLYLLSSDQASVLDAAMVADAPRARSDEHGDRWLVPDVETPGAANSIEFRQDVVINEILYHRPVILGDPGVPPTYDTTTILPFNATWRHSKAVTSGAGDLPVSLGAGWEDVAHPVDGTRFFSGQGPFGYETAALPVSINTAFNNPLTNTNFITTYYFEVEFGLTQAQIDELDDLALQHMVDDGVVFYLNGEEVDRFNMPAGVPSFTTFASSGIGEAALSGFSTISTDDLVALPAMNRLSAEVHQRATDSSDVVFGAELVSRVLLDPGVPASDSAQDPEQWIELYNRGAAPVDLTGWSFTDGIQHSFQPGTTIQPGEYLVVAKDAAALLAKHPGIDVVGNFQGQLSRAGERIELTDDVGNPADIVDYRDSGRWSSAADGGGSSLELRDPDADNSRPEAWSPSDESNRSPWQTFTYGGLAGSSVVTLYNELVLGLLDEGEILLDDISVVENPQGLARQLIQNGTFENDAVGGTAGAWRIIGTHQDSRVIVDPDDPNNQVLQLIASGPTEHMHNHAETTLKDGNTFVTINPNAEYEISFRAKWISGSRLLNTRLYFDRLQRTTVLPIPGVSGTPGAVNSTFEDNIGPTYDSLHHQPVVPQANQDVTVSVVAHDPDDVASMTLYYSIDGGPFSMVAMTGLGDGGYEGTIPGQPRATVVQFYVEGQDALGGVSTFPAAGPDSRALVKFEDDQASTAEINNFRIVMTTPDANLLHTQTNVMSNHRIGATVVYNEREVFYDVGVRLKGSERGRGKDVRVSFNVGFDPLQLFRGVHGSVAIDRSGAGDGAALKQREILVRQTFTHAGDIPGEYDDLIHVVAPRAAHNGSAMLQMARYNDVYLDSQFENGGDGRLFEYELIYYPTTTDTGTPEGLKLPQPDSVTGVPVAGRGSDKEDYRWFFLIKNNRDEDDYSTLIPALTAIGMSAGSDFHEQTGQLLDVDQWLRTYAAMAMWAVGDNYSTNAQHNGQFYTRPEDGKTLLFPWDMDFATSAGAGSSLTANNELRTKFLTLPENVHLFWGHAYDIVTTTFNSQYLDPWADHFNELLPDQDLSTFKSFISAHSASALNQINSAVTPIAFTISTNGGADFSTDQSSVTLDGTGWVNVREIRLSGSDVPLSLTWPQADRWQAEIPLRLGENVTVLEAYDHQGNLVAQDTITITASVPNPVNDFLRFSEIHYHPSDPTTAEIDAGFDDADEFEFLELVNTSAALTLDLSGVALVEGVEFTIPPGTTLEPGGRAVIVENLEAFEFRYGDGLPVLGQWDGALNNGGERLVLVDASSGIVVDVTYSDDGAWPGRADGNGSSLESVDPSLDPNDPQSWRSSAQFDGSPGTVGVAIRADVVVNEVLSHTDPPQVDSIELFNPTGQVVDIGNWYVSDSNDQYRKYRIPAGTMLGAGEYLVLDESDFNPTPMNPGPNDFALSSAHGDDVYLVAADAADRLLRFADHTEFGAQANGESWGRWPDSQGVMYPMLTVTLGAENSGPRIGPVVISEVMYGPVDPDGEGPQSADDFEFVEIFNPTAGAVDLTNWRLEGGVDYAFAAGRMLAAGEVLVILSFDPDDPNNAQRVDDFRAVYALDEGVALTGGYQGTLNNAGETIRLLRPDEPPLDEPDFLPGLLEDMVPYDDEPPWPTTADAGGDSLTRVDPTLWGVDAASWIALPPSPGTVSDAPPTVVSVSANADQVDPPDLPRGMQPSSWILQASDLRSIVVRFSVPITASANDLRLTNLGIDAPNDPDTPFDLTDQHLSISGNVLTLSFGPDELAEGIYQLEILPTLTGTDGKALDGDGDGVAGDGYVVNGDLENRLLRLIGNWNGDDGVSIFDFNVFSYWFGQPITTAPDYVNLNRDDGISIFDFTPFSERFGDGFGFPPPPLSELSTLSGGVQPAAPIVDSSSTADDATSTRRPGSRRPVDEVRAPAPVAPLFDRLAQSRREDRAWEGLVDRILEELGDDDPSELDEDGILNGLE